jgi:hypothetical protein
MHGIEFDMVGIGLNEALSATQSILKAPQLMMGTI